MSQFLDAMSGFDSYDAPGPSTDNLSFLDAAIQGTMQDAVTTLPVYSADSSSVGSHFSDITQGVTDFGNSILSLESTALNVKNQQRNYTSQATLADQQAALNAARNNLLYQKQLASVSGVAQPLSGREFQTMLIVGVVALIFIAMTHK